MRSKASIKGEASASAAELQKYVKDFEQRISDVEFKVIDFSGAIGEKLDKGDYAVLASDKVTKAELSSLLPDPEMQD